MTHDEVAAPVGAPVKIFQGDDGPLSTRWCFSQSPRGRNFRVRMVTFDRTGHVSRRISWYYAASRWGLNQTDIP